MTKRERSELQECVRLIWQDEETGGWEDGMRRLAKLAGIRIPALEVTGTAISVWELLKREPSQIIELTSLEGAEREERG